MHGWGQFPVTLRCEAEVGVQLTLFAKWVQWCFFRVVILLFPRFQLVIVIFKTILLCFLPVRPLTRCLPFLVVHLRESTLPPVQWRPLESLPDNYVRLREVHATSSVTTNHALRPRGVKYYLRRELTAKLILTFLSKWASKPLWSTAWHHELGLCLPPALCSRSFMCGTYTPFITTWRSTWGPV